MEVKSLNQLVEAVKEKKIQPNLVIEVYTTTNEEEIVGGDYISFFTVIRVLDKDGREELYEGKRIENKKLAMGIQNFKDHQTIQAITSAVSKHLGLDRR